MIKHNLKCTIFLKSFVCVVMSHGTKLPDGGLSVFGADNAEIDIEAQAKSLFSNNKYPTLMNKPKLFFVDACWGEGKMPIAYSFVEINSGDRSRSLAAICNNGHSSVTMFVQNPDISDLLFSFCTLPTFPSYRDDKGNWFIQEFTSALDELGETRTLSDILMHRVRQNLMLKTTSCVAQMSVDHWMLNCMLFSHRKR